MGENFPKAHSGVPAIAVHSSRATTYVTKIERHVVSMNFVSMLKSLLDKVLIYR